MKNIVKHSKIYEVEVALIRQGIESRTDRSFCKMTTIGCGGDIALVAYPSNIEQLQIVLSTVHKCDVPYLVLGRGSNVLASEQFFWGVMISTCKMVGIESTSDGILVEAGTSTVSVARYLAQHNCGGAEFLYSLPATIGGAAVMNAGCFGGDMAQIVLAVQYIDDKGILHEVEGKDCNFVYRGSMFKNNARLTIVQVLLKRQIVDYDIMHKCRAMYDTKRNTQPLAQKSFGCAFYGEGFAASQLIDLSGLKGCQIGGAKISEKHAGFVINVDKAKSQDIYLLLTHIKNAVRQKFRCDLHTEVCLVGTRWENNNDIGRLPYTYT